MMIINPTHHKLQDFGASLKTSTPIQYSAEELEAAKQHAYEQGLIEGKEQGFAQGQTHAISDHQTQLDAVLNAIESKVTEAANHYQDIKIQSAQEVLTFIQIIMDKLLPHWVAEHGLSELITTIQHIINHIYTHTQIIVRIHPHMLAKVRKKLQHFLTKHTDVVLAPGENMDRHACEINWDGGGAQFSLEAIAHQITQAIACYTLPPNLTSIRTKEAPHD
jgi:flagellar biosynthesis/type III secretory pathway protein FliH